MPVLAADMNDVSLVIRTRNCRNELRECLEALDRQTLKTERIVVDSRSSDGTPELAARAGCRVFSIPPDTFAYGDALNLGYRHAGGALLGSLSAHSILLEPTALERLAGVLRAADDRVAGVYGCPVYADDQAAAPPSAEPDERITWDAFAACCNKGLSNSCSLIRRSLWEATPFPPERCEDQKWAARHLKDGYATLCVRNVKFRYKLGRRWDYYVRKHRDDFLMLYRTWPEAEWPRAELLDAPRNRFRVWSITHRLRQAGWNWDSLSDARKWHAAHELGLYWASAVVRGGRGWRWYGAVDLARAFLLPKGRKGWQVPTGEWP